MRLATTDANRLAIWVELVKSRELPIEFHVFAQGYELRCGDAPPLRLDLALRDRPPW